MNTEPDPVIFDALAVTFKQIEAFYASATLGTISAAAQMLQRSQPTVSREIQLLEKALNVRLFQRVQGRVRLTEEGKTLIANAREVLRVAHSFAASAAALSFPNQQALRIACSPSIVNKIMPKILQYIERKFPTVSTEIIEADTGAVEKIVLNQQADFGLCHVPRSIDGLQMVPIQADPLVLVASYDAMKKVNPPHDLSGFERVPLLSWPENKHPEYFQLIRQICIQRHLDPLILTGTDHISGSKRYLLSEGRAFSIVPSDAAQNLDAHVTYTSLGAHATAPLAAVYTGRLTATALEIIHVLRQWATTHSLSAPAPSSSENTSKHLRK
ncbi:MAG: LysR family transcriptional regulator [Arcanobacterium sp.]|nr:LysR family transcriptional regulator [Arcanobacterium sp.]MDY5589265.1 LysR family transcriptional regulator [Arcanobacterium sp.]